MVRDRERGFTLMELMITVAIIGVLAKVAIPVFFSQSRKAKATSEITAMFAELAIKQEQYKTEFGAYLVAAACPAAPSAVGQSAAACVAVGQPWKTLRVQLPTTNLYCSYQVVTGTGVGTNNPSGFTFTSPITNWYYILATCDMDNSATKNSTYFTSSVDPKVQKLNEGF